MIRVLSNQNRVLGIALSSRGFGFALLEGERLVDWGVKSATGDKNAGCLTKLKALIGQYEPHVIVLDDTEESRRAARIKDLAGKIISLASTLHVRVKLFGRDKLRRLYFADGPGTKHALAQILAERFPEELGVRLPPKRRPWMSEDYRMNIFDAVALALALQIPKAKRNSHLSN